MKTIAVSKFRAHIIQILKEIESGEIITITSRGKAVAKIVPPDDTKKNALKRLQEIGKKAVIHDVLSPIDEEWEAMK